MEKKERERERVRVDSGLSLSQRSKLLPATLQLSPAIRSINCYVVVELARVGF